MASASDPSRKGTSDSNADDDDVNDHKEKMILLLKENPASVLTPLSKLLSCDACKSFARGPIRYCGLLHKICSLCYTEGVEKCLVLFCLAEGCTKKLMVKTFENTELTEMIRAMKLPVPCRNRKNGCPEKGEEEEVEEHEIECEFRLVETNVLSGGKQMFKDLLCSVDKLIKDHGGKWRFCNERNNENHAFRDSIEPDGHRFRIVLNASDSSFLEASATVFGGEHVAKKYRVEMRLNSCEKEFTITHHGPVFSVDVKEPWNCEQSFSIGKKKFALFNNGFKYFGDHNKDKNGETTVPITVKIMKKELDIPKEDSGTLVDMGDKEK